MQNSFRKNCFSSAVSKEPFYHFESRSKTGCFQRKINYVFRNCILYASPSDRSDSCRLGQQTFIKILKYVYLFYFISLYQVQNSNLLTVISARRLSQSLVIPKSEFVLCYFYNLLIELLKALKDDLQPMCYFLETRNYYLLKVIAFETGTFCS